VSPVVFISPLMNVHSLLNTSLKIAEEGRNKQEVYYSLYIVSNYSAVIGIYIYIHQ
jgi:hypothetical protein